MPPGSTRPVSKVPSALVTVCAWVPILVQVTLPPIGTTAAKPQVLMSDALPSTIAWGTASCWAEATMGSSARAAVRSAAIRKGRLRIGLVVRLVVGGIGITRLRSDGGRPRRHDLLGCRGIVDDDRGRHAVQASRAVRLAEILECAWRVEDHAEGGARVEHVRVKGTVVSGDGVSQRTGVGPQDRGTWADMHSSGRKTQPLHVDGGVSVLRENRPSGSKQTHCKRGPQDTQA